MENTHISEIGVSVIVCCYNSAIRIKPTLTSLAMQETRESLNWEIILVDNASTDQTQLTSRQVWKSLKKDIPFRIVYEPMPGLGNARKRGLKESKYSVLIYCDDDNWLNPTYVQDAFDILRNNPCAAAAGGRGIPVFENKKPEWFDEYSEAYAIGSQSINEENGVVLNLYGAGMAVNKSALLDLYETGFNPLFKGRVGKQLSSSEDCELTYAWVLRGYQLVFSDTLTFQHFLPRKRLSKAYLTKLFVSFGKDGPIRNLYYSYLTKKKFHRLIRNWYIHAALSIYRTLKYLIIPPKKGGRIIYLKWNAAYFQSLWKLKSRYTQISDEIERWREYPKKRHEQNSLNKASNDAGASLRLMQGSSVL